MDSLGRILVEHTDELMERWLVIVREGSLGKRGLSEAALKDDLPLQYRVIGEAIRKGVEGPHDLWTNVPARLDPEERVLQNVPIEEVVDEYAYAVDAVRRWVEERGIEIPFEEFAFFHTAMFELVAAAVGRYAAYQAHRVEELGDSDRRTSEFLSLLSHELRNPLMPIRNSLYILERVPPGGEQARRALEVIDRQVAHLTRMVDDLLDVTRVTRGKIRLQRERMDLVKVVRQTMQDHGVALAERQVVLELPDDPVWIDGDRTRIAQAIGNLLVNAEKFTSPPDGLVSVVVEASGERARLTITDNGIGIAPEMVGHVFEPFTQADSSLDRSQGGLGLGLALVKGLIEMHGGEVRAHSEGLGRGSSFTIKLPLDQRPGMDRPAPARTTAVPRRKVLIIEDNLDAANSLSVALELSGHEVAVAYDSHAGLALARDFHPDVVICDIGLPGDLDGFAVARALRLDPATAGSRLVAVTGYAQPDDRRRVFEAGFDDHLAKPVNLGSLERLLAQSRVPRTPDHDGAATPPETGRPRG